MYADVSVIVCGALAGERTLTSVDAINQYVDQEGREALANGLPTEVYIVWHEHEMTGEECTCIQYVTDHHPDCAWNQEATS